MTANPARRMRRAARRHRQPTRMSEYQRNQQLSAPRGIVKVHAHLHGLDINDAVALDEAGAFEGVPCLNCEQAIEWSDDFGEFQHHATKNPRCTGGRGVATPPDWYTGDPVLEESLDDLTDYDGFDEDLTAGEPDIADFSNVDDDEPAPPRRRHIDGDPYDTEFARGVLTGLQGKPTYQGSVHADEVERRRLRNRDANRARRANRRARVKRSRARHANRGAA